jgi:hypothetical protein
MAELSRYQKNREHFLSYQREYYQKNKAAIADYNAMYFQTRTKYIRPSRAKPKYKTAVKETKIPKCKEKIFVEPKPVPPPPPSLGAVAILPGILLDWNAL